MHTSHLAAFGAVLAALLVAHSVADYWLQTSWQAAHKADRISVRPEHRFRDTGQVIGWDKWWRVNGRGWAANLAHVTTYTILCTVVLAVLGWRFGLPLDSARLAVGLAVSAITHAFADRRRPLASLAARIGKDHTWVHEQGGLALLDQSWHLGWLLVAALFIT